MNCFTALPGIILLLLISLSNLHAAIIRIPQDEASIQDGCDNGQNGDTLRISAGRWAESVLIHNRFFVLEGDTSHPENTIINPPAGGPAVQIMGNLGGQIVLKGLTLTGGTGYELDGVTYGGGIYCRATGNSSLLIERCVISGNMAEVGGGIYSRGVHPYTSLCRIEFNSATLGAAAYCDGPATNNYTMGFTWTIFAHNEGQNSIVELDSIPQPIVLRNCTISKNESQTYLFCLIQSQLDIQGTILWDNNENIIYRTASRSSLLFRYSLVQDGQQCVEGRIDQWTGDMLTVSPQFTNPATNDFSLRTTSPCIDHGYPYNTLDRDGSRSDMGAIPFHHHNGLMFTLIGGVNFESIADASLNITTPRNYSIHLETDQNGRASIFDFPDNAHPNTFIVEIQHPAFVDRNFDFQLEVNDTTALTYTLSPATFSVSPSSLSLNLLRGESTTASIEVRNTTELTLNWATQRSLQYSILAEFDIEDYGRVDGFAFDGDFFYLPQYLPDGDRYIHVLGRNGRFVRRFLQPNQDGAGLRDLEWDGTNLWGVGNGRSYCFTRDGELLQSWSIGITATSIIWDSGRNILWVAGALSSVIGYDRNGNRVGQSLPRQVQVHHGMAYNPDDEQDHKLYILTTGANDETDVLVKMNTTTLDTLMVGTLENRVGRSLGNGLTMTTLYQLNGRATWVVQTIDSTGRNIQHKLSLLQFDDSQGWLVPWVTKGIVQPGNAFTIDLGFRTVLGETDTLDDGDYETTLSVALDLPSEQISIPIRLHVGPNAVQNDKGDIPHAHHLSPPFPNPFNSFVNLDFQMQSASNVELKVVDLSGRVVKEVLKGEYPCGSHRLVWNADGVAAGEYLLLFEADGVRQVRKVVLIK